MAKHYRNPFEDPDAEFYGKKVKDYKIPKRKETPLEKKAAKVSEIKDYIYVPTIDLYVAKEKSLYGLPWHVTHEELHKKGLQMLTIRQFIDFVLYLQENKTNIKGAKKILDEILAKRRNSWRGEWLDACFVEENGKLFIHYNHQIANGSLQFQKEPLEECLMENPLKINFQNCNKQGMPTKKGGNIHYWRPIAAHVAGFWASSRQVGLNCGWDTSLSPRAGVRAAFKKEKKKKTK